MIKHYIINETYIVGYWNFEPPKLGKLLPIAIGNDDDTIVDYNFIRIKKIREIEASEKIRITSC